MHPNHSRPGGLGVEPVPVVRFESLDRTIGTRPNHGLNQLDRTIAIFGPVARFFILFMFVKGDWLYTEERNFLGRSRISNRNRCLLRHFFRMINL